MKFAGWFCIVVGALMLLQWGFFIGTNQVPELVTAPVEIAFHLAAEAITAITLLVSGVGLSRQRGWGRSVSLVALGMLLYTVVGSPGYFAQQGVWPLVGMFTVLLVLALVSIYRVIRTKT